jgi:hypothetical protein
MALYYLLPNKENAGDYTWGEIKIYFEEIKSLFNNFHDLPPFQSFMKKFNFKDSDTADHFLSKNRQAIFDNFNEVKNDLELRSDDFGK